MAGALRAAEAVGRRDEPVREAARLEERKPVPLRQSNPDGLDAEPLAQEHAHVLGELPTARGAIEQSQKPDRGLALLLHPLAFGDVPNRRDDSGRTAFVVAKDRALHVGGKHRPVAPPVPDFAARGALAHHLTHAGRGRFHSFGSMKLAQGSADQFVTTEAVHLCKGVVDEGEPLVEVADGDTFAGLLHR